MERLVTLLPKWEPPPKITIGLLMEILIENYCFVGVNQDATYEIVCAAPASNILDPNKTCFEFLFI
jgi:hypothetical protein